MWNEDGDAGSDTFTRDLIVIAIIVVCIAAGGYFAAEWVNLHTPKFQHRIEAQ